MKNFGTIYLSKIEHYEKVDFDYWIVYALNGMPQV